MPRSHSRYGRCCAASYISRYYEAEGIRRLTVGDIALEAQGTLEVADTTLSRENLAIPHVNLAITEGRLIRPSDHATLVNAITLEATATLDEITPTDPATGALNPELLAALSAEHLILRRRQMPGMYSCPTWRPFRGFPGRPRRTGGPY